MKILAILLSASLCLASPAMAQTWGSDYNMGSIGVSAGTEASGTITLDCAESDNAVVDQGALSIFVRPQPGMLADGPSPNELAFDIDGQAVTLPVSNNLSDGFVYEKTSETRADAATLIGLLAQGQVLIISSGTNPVAEINLDGAAAALNGLDVCLRP